MTQNLHAGHRQRVKRRYLSEGLDSFADHEVLEMLLFYAIPMKDTNPLAHKLLNEFGSLANLFEADPKDIERRCGINEHASLLISLISALTRRYLQEKQGNHPLLTGSTQAGEYAASLFVGQTYEAFYLICLNSQNRVNYASLVQKGTINEAPVYPRIIVETALRHQANAVIFAHNHPGGSLQPSIADRKITEQLIRALQPISISVVDHIIVAGEKYYSFAEHHLL